MNPVFMAGSFLFWFMTILTLLCVPLLMLILWLSGGAAFTMVSARIKGAPLILLERKDGACGLKTGDYKGGVLNIKGYGKFTLNPNAMRRFHGNVIGIAYEKVGHVPDPKFIKAAKRLNEKGIKDYDQVVDAKGAVIQELALDGLSKGEREKLLKNGKITEEQAKGLSGEEKIEANEILNDLSIIVDYFKYNVNPSEIQENVNAEIALHEKKKKMNAVMIFTGAAIVIIALGIFFYIITTMVGRPDCAAEISAAMKGLGMIAKPVATAVTGEPSII